jgi:hypothetical protein
MLPGNKEGFCMADNLLRRIRRLDEQRPGLPGEHWVALAGGLGLWLATRRHPSMAVRVLASVAGTVLVARAMTGREVPSVLRRLPYAGRTPRRRDWIG